MEELARRQERRWSSVFRSSSVSSFFSSRNGKGGAGTASSTTDAGESRAQCDLARRCSSERPSSILSEPVPTLRQQLASKYCILMIVHSVIQAILYPFVSTSAEGLFGRDVNNFLGIGLPFSCISCVVYGKLTDMYGIMKVLLGINTLMAAVYGLALFKTTVASYLAAFLLILYVGFYSSQVYCYVSDTFATKQFGRIVGTIFMIAGFCSLLKIPLQSMVVHVFDSVYTWPVVIMIGVCFLNYIVLGVLYYFKRKLPHPFWPKEATADAELREEKKSREKATKARNKERFQGDRDGELAAQTTGVPLTEMSVNSDVAVDLGFVSASRDEEENQLAGHSGR
ncbi:transporter [Cystoisospora suis]|uniref:Transporter n=1 Tax=Cystoisospora suis TaxID=483139 RepID=A0A2C6KQD6_9APIC|nr:transporter [Cystoisospora suis]